MKLFLIRSTLLVLMFSNALATAAVPRLTNFNEPNFVAVQKKLSAGVLVNGKFEQTRTLTLLTKPLVSTGHFSLSKKDGLRWEQLAPFTSKLLLTKTSLQQQIGDQPANTITQQQQPILFTFSNIFLSVFNGDITSVQQYFHVYFSGNIMHWQLVLKPYTSPLDKAIKSIQLQGANTIKSITIVDAQANTMHIKLFDIKQTS